MKKVFTIMVVAVVVIMSMLTVTGCSTKYSRESVIDCKGGLEDGRDYGVIKFVRYSYHGSFSYDEAIEAREFHKTQLGEVVSEVYKEDGGNIYWFRAAKIAE